MRHEHEEQFLISAYLDRELTRDEYAHVSSHLGVCQACRGDLENLQQVKKVLVSAPRRAVPPRLLARLEALPLAFSWFQRFKMAWAFPRIWIPVGSVAAAVLLPVKSLGPRIVCPLTEITALVTP